MPLQGSFGLRRLKLHVLLRHFALGLLITFHRRQRKRRHDKLPPTDREREIFTDAIPDSGAALASLSTDGKFMHFQHALRLLLVVGLGGAGVVAGMAAVHEMREGRQFQRAVREELGPARQCRGTRM